MTRKVWLVLGAAALGLSGCDTLELACTTQFVYGLSVEVVDAVSGVGIADGATLTLTDGAYTETATEPFNGSTLVGAGERAGTYAVTVVREGYQAWTRAGVVVTEDECHVIPVSLRVELVPAP